MLRVVTLLPLLFFAVNILVGQAVSAGEFSVYVDKTVLRMEPGEMGAVHITVRNDSNETYRLYVVVDTDKTRIHYTGCELECWQRHIPDEQCTPGVLPVNCWVYPSDGGGLAYSIYMLGDRYFLDPGDTMNITMYIVAGNKNYNIDVRVLAQDYCTYTGQCLSAPIEIAHLNTVIDTASKLDLKVLAAAGLLAVALFVLRLMR